MVRIIVERIFTESGKRYVEAAGLSTDSKPDNCVTGSLFLEVNTGDVYAYAEGTPGSWQKIAALGGGN